MHKEHATVDSQQVLAEKHGDEAMGLSHEKTKHHFLMSADGGVIEMTANEATDKASAEAIRSHLSHIAVMFGARDFSAPMFIHDGIPPGVTTMKLVRGRIVYTYEELPAGGCIRIQSRKILLRSLRSTTSCASKLSSITPATT